MSKGFDIRKIELGAEYNEKAINVKNTEEEFEILTEAVKKNVETPYTYNRLSILLVKKGDKKEAIKVCKKYGKIYDKNLSYNNFPEYISPREKSIFKRLKRLESS